MENAVRIGLALPNEFFSRINGWENYIGEFDEIDGLFDYIFNQGNQILNHLSLKGDVGYTFHLHGDLGLFQYNWFKEPLKLSLEQHQPTFSHSFHIPFKDHQLPLQPLFKETLMEQINLASFLKSEAIVLHAPRTVENTCKEFTRQFCDSEILKSIRNAQIPICFENAQDSGTYFQSFKHLLELKIAIEQGLKQSNDDDLSHLIQFCFDTGHYLLYQQRDGFEEKDWTEYSQEFLSHVRLVHVHSNDGSKDHHLLPYTTFSVEDLPSAKFPFNHKFFYENCHRVMKWLLEYEQVRSVMASNSRDFVLEIEPFLLGNDIEDFWRRFFKKID